MRSELYDLKATELGIAILGNQDFLVKFELVLLNFITFRFQQVPEL